MPYVNQRWLGGMLTNFETISKRVAKMKEYQRMRDSGEFDAMPKKEALLLRRAASSAKLERNLGGIRNMERLPDAVFILDTKKEHIAVTEANKLGIPIVAVVDTNCDPDVIQYVIPGNDDAIRSGTLMCRVIADAVEEGRFIASKPPRSRPAERTADEEAEVAAQQAEARRQAPPQAEREARLAPPPRSPSPTPRRRAPRRPRPRPSRRPRRAPGPPARRRRPRPPPRPAEAEVEPRRPGQRRSPPRPRRRRRRPPLLRPPDHPRDHGVLTPMPMSSPPRTSRPCARPPAPG
jgi:small subunit ribosomal protein S2